MGASEDYDIFISHASEDKEAIARPLAFALLKKGYNVFLDELEIKLGDSISQKINEGLSQAPNGIVIISPAFFSKNWTKAELNSITNMVIDTNKKLLPIWHGITYDDVIRNVPLLADRKAALSSEGVEVLVNKIQDAIGMPIRRHFSQTNYAWSFYDFIPELQLSMLESLSSICSSVDLMEYHVALENVEDFLRSINTKKLDGNVQEKLEKIKEKINNDIQDDLCDLWNGR